jgi:hypothetical protein
MKMMAKRQVGRPRTTLDDLPDRWEQIICDAAQNGASAVELRCLLGVSKDAWNTLKEDSEEFSTTVNKAHDLCQVWWERAGRKMAVGETHGNATTWIFNMKNRFGWGDRQQIDVNQIRFSNNLDEFYDEITLVSPSEEM